MFFLLLLSRSSAAAANEPSAAVFHHVPPAEARAGAAFVLEAHVERAWQSTLELRYRRAGEPAFQAQPFRRTGEDLYRATIPAEAVRPPGFEYYVVGDAEAAHFASARYPHLVAVHEDAGTIERSDELARLKGRRARARAAFEQVDFGSRTINGVRSIGDHYYRIDADFTYRLLRFPLYHLRFGYSRLTGETPETERDSGECIANGLEKPADADCVLSPAGFKTMGWAEVRLHLSPLLDLDARGIVAATVEGVRPGARGELRIGHEDGSHVAFGAEYLEQAGATLLLRLAWDTVPRLPMAASIELSDVPSSHRAMAVRLLYDVAYPLEAGVRVGGRIGYQARDQQIGGLALGGSVAVDF